MARKDAAETVSRGSVTPLRPRKMADVILRELRRQIVSGEYGEGSTLPTEGELVKRFGVSRTPVREAIRALEFEGLVSSRQGARNGAEVRSPSIRIAARHTGMVLSQRGASLNDVYQARMAIEPFAARLLAQAATPEIVAELRGLYQRQCDVVEDAPAWGRAAADFHQAVVDRCGNQTMAVLIAQLEDIVAGQTAIEMEAVGSSTVAERQLADAAHARLVKLIERGDGEKAETFWRAHLEAAWPVHKLTETLNVEDLLAEKPAAHEGASQALALVRPRPNP